MRARARALVCAALTIPAAGSVGAQPQPSSKVTFDHLRENDNRIYTVRAAENEQFTVTILNTCPADFDYGVTPVGEGKKLAPELSPLTTKTISITVSDRYAGYIIAVRRKLNAGTTCYDSTASAADKSKPAALHELTLTIVVNVEPWSLSMAGAFTATGLTDPVYALRTVGGQTEKQVVEDTSKRDTASLAIAAFIHVYHARFPHVAPMFGIGIQQQSTPVYYFGGGFRLGNVATINGGMSIGSIRRLPAGLNAGDFTSDANALTNLATQRVRSWYIGLSFAFIDVRNQFTKPFAQAGDAKP